MVTWAIQESAMSLTSMHFMVKAVEEEGGKVVRVGVYPSTKTIEFKGEVPEGNKVIPYGTTALVKLAKDKNWEGLFHNGNFLNSVWTQHRKDMLNFESKVVKVSEISEVTEGRDPKDLIFVKPHAESKLFTSMTLTIQELDNVLKTLTIGRSKLTPDTEIITAHRKVILSETRWFVVNGKVIDGSAYRIGDRNNAYHIGNEKEIAAAQAMADIWLPHPTCVMDIAETPEGPKVVEFNCFNSSGIYIHDLRKIVRAVHEMF